ncbi:hypothetical protein, partial [Escherichia coli]|uniref:hypothetical protein n=1 Tax=Escherichia coli TaxID=562 RepID=UPI001600A66F
PETASEIAETTQITRENEMTAEIQTIEIPVIREKIVKVPVVREKIVTRVVYVNAKDENDRQIQNDNQQTNDNPKNAAKESFTVKNRLRDNRYSTQINLEGFQVVSDLKPIIIKGENNEQ